MYIITYGSALNCLNICLCFYLVKSFPVHASDNALRDERLVVDLFYQTEDGDGFRLLGQQYDDFDRFAGVSAYTVEDGAAAIKVMDDPFGYFIIFLGKDQELDRLPVSVQYDVDYIIAYKHFDETEDDFFDIMEQEKRRTDDDKIAEQQSTADRYVLVFVDDCSDDIRSPRTAVCRKDEPEAGSAKERTDHDGHERLVVQKRLPFQKPFEERQGGRQGKDSEDRFYQEFESQYF